MSTLLPKNPSEAFKRRNPHIYGSKLESDQPVEMPKPKARNFKLILTGQIKGGKNNYIVTRQGKHIPKKDWAAWRDEKVDEIQRQAFYEPIKEPTNIRLTYVAGDKRRRDMPAVIDSIFHILERAEVVSDDALLWVSESSRSYDKENPRVEIEFLTT